MQFGNKVKITHRLSKSGESLYEEQLTPEQQEKWENGEVIELVKRKAVPFDKPKEGILVGKRLVSYSTTLDYDPERERFFSIGGVSENIYLVATSLHRLYKVREEHMEVAEHAASTKADL